MIVCVCVRGVGEGVDGSVMPLPTRPQQYCDPASLVCTVPVASLGLKIEQRAKLMILIH